MVSCVPTMELIIVVIELLRTRKLILLLINEMEFITPLWIWICLLVITIEVLFQVKGGLDNKTN
jgi:hypothetical protein